MAGLVVLRLPALAVSEEGQRMYDPTDAVWDLVWELDGPYQPEAGASGKETVNRERREAVAAGVPQPDTRPREGSG